MASLYSNDLGRSFITDGDAGQVVIFDLGTFKKVGEVKAENGRGLHHL